MDGLKVLEIIKKINPWFKNNQVPQAHLEPFKRREFSTLEKDLGQLDLTTLIIGARRVGKSVLMYQLIDALLKKGVEGKRILFIQGDNTLLTEFAASGNLINFILELYQKHILEKNFDDLTDTLYIFLDEAQSLDAWDREIKIIMDQKYKIKFIVTGSSSFELRRGSETPLTGRVSIQPIFPFSFADYTRYYTKEEEQGIFGSKLSEFSERFKNSLLVGDLDSSYKAARETEKFISNSNLKKRFENYLFFGGFPRVVANHNDDYAKYLRDLLTTTISKDILTYVEIRDPQAFERLMVNLCLMAGSMTKYKKFAEVLGVDERSVIKYIDYYIESHWAFVSSPYVFSNKMDSVSTEKKFYVIDSGIINTLAFKDEIEFRSDREHRGHVLENVIHNHLLAFKQLRMGTFQSYIPFWTESNTSKEIDFIFEVKGGVLPIEVKQKISHDGNDELALLDFLSKRTTAKFGILTTEETLELKGRLLLIPNLLFTLLL
ncbi:hypothetical protein A3D77_07940 [Candidatus Gottesmanbacteria bacterium RIFCSPHIGHO2_02_FULL_39_11]|uniref:AAA+ ATPase domain-containing protein n=1 Tax=Candidatus Gottesmanbacteria bacterium RIFCSPHIGHO2_02_FULL_39_11 TaxID=1798382 RepID=A0A1F5ZL89_9BACT|nr:MAG: hypothetical protein A3D77_07940 [Candidatus Gottesmanbacteria bacterium RIFCSPHIGHO2_02_FULL_39_11]